MIDEILHLYMAWLSYEDRIAEERKKSVTNK
jgi:hypothetical protein